MKNSANKIHINLFNTNNRLSYFFLSCLFLFMIKEIYLIIVIDSELQLIFICYVLFSLYNTDYFAHVPKTLK